MGQVGARWLAAVGKLFHRHILAETRDEDFQDAGLRQIVLSGELSDGLGHVPAKAECH
jgi:hypothetical protein